MSIFIVLYSCGNKKILIFLVLEKNNFLSKKWLQRSYLWIYNAVCVRMWIVCMCVYVCDILTRLLCVFLRMSWTFAFYIYNNPKG